MTKMLDGTADDDPGPSLSILIEYDDWLSLKGGEKIIGDAYQCCLQLLPDIAGRDVTILLSGDSDIAALNATYRGQDKPTNVLSFPASGCSVPGQPEPLGDIIIAYETVMREAAEEGKTLLFHLAHLAVHGLLHLAGYDHVRDDDAEIMEQLERRILAGVGVSDPYRTSLEDAPHLTG